MAEIVSVKRTGEVVFDKRGNVLCDHGKRPYFCKPCNGLAFCEHGIYKRTCKECKGTLICEHNKQKTQCRDCGGSQICSHNKYKSSCKECGGSKLCKSSWCESIKVKKYNNYCLRCFVNLHPEIKVSRNYKTKETDVVSQITESFPNFTWVTDKRIKDGCSRRRPDVLLDLGSHIIIIEVDENRHTDYDCSCEHKRLMQLSQDVGHRSIVFIRFNPDDYIDTNGKKITSCWRVNNKTGLMMISNTKIEEWSKRIEILKETINYWVSNPTEKTVEIIELFY